MPALEGLRLIGRLDLYMLKRVITILAQPENGHWPPVHVNCSSYSITRPAFAAEVLAMLAEHNVAPGVYVWSLPKARWWLTRSRRACP